MNRTLFGILGIFAVASTVVAGQVTPQAKLPSAKVGSPEELDFEKRIRPLLHKHCVPCHNAKTTLGGLRLDTAAGAVKAVFPGDAVASPLVQAIRYEGKHKMPPSGKLPASEIAALTGWVASGAHWPASLAAISSTSTHWAFIPAKRFVAPKVAGAATNIDAFLRAPVIASGLKPAPRTDKRTLIRRAYFDITGLPPAPADVEAFVADKSPDAFSKVVDTLLASPAFGERWGRHWLDVARYADSNGLDENLAHGNAFRYRDWVVKALNQDLPYDRFVQYQVAGDLLAPKTDTERADMLTATGYLSLGPKVLAEQDKPKLVMDIVDEQIEVVSKSVMGVTIACARCHDHKFDPISTKEYYALAGIFKSTKTMENLGFVSAWNERAVETGDAKVSAAKYDSDILAPLRVKAEKARASVTQALTASGGAAIAATSFSKGNVAKDAYGPGSINSEGSPANIEYKLTVPAAGDYKFASEYASNENRSVDIFVNGAKQLSGVAGRDTGGFRGDRKAWDVLGTIKLKAGENVLRITRGGAIPHFFRYLVLPVGTSDIAAIQTIAEKADKDLADAAAKKPVPVFVMAVEDAKPEDVKIHVRGDTQSLGDVAPRGFPAALCGGDFIPVPDPEKSGRLSLAMWMTKSSHPLTSRVMVDRVFRHLFGLGLVSTPDNWGIRGEKPSNPKLLDTLAVTFAVDDKWSVKRFIKRLMLTDTYAQSSVAYSVKPKAMEVVGGKKRIVADPMIVDPANQLLWRANRRRLDAEPLRDAMLAVSGQLDKTLGGTFLGTNNRDYVTNDQSGNGARYDAPRRSIYLPVIRNAVYDYLQAFDFGDPSMVNAARTPTTVAPQALYVMNSPMVIDFSRKFAQRMLALPGISEEDRINAATYQAIGRPQNDAEKAVAKRFFIAYEMMLEEAVPDSAERRRRIWDVYCQALLASNSFAYVE